MSLKIMVETGDNLRPELQIEEYDAEIKTIHITQKGAKGEKDDQVYLDKKNLKFLIQALNAMRTN